MPIKRNEKHYINTILKQNTGQEQRLKESAFIDDLQQFFSIFLYNFTLCGK